MNEIYPRSAPGPATIAATIVAILGDQ